MKNTSKENVCPGIVNIGMLPKNLSKLSASAVAEINMSLRSL